MSKLPTARDLIAKIIPNQANFEHCGEHRTINGSLLFDIERAIESHTQAHTEGLRGRVKELEAKNIHYREALEYLLEGVNNLPALTAIEGTLVPHCEKAKEALKNNEG